MRYNKGFVQIIIPLILTLLAIAGIGYIAFTTRQKNPEQTPTISQTTTPTVSEPALQKDEGWMTYKGYDIGPQESKVDFEIKYPPNWKLKVYDPASVYGGKSSNTAVLLTGEQSEQNVSSHKLEIIINDPEHYSTSMAVCANQWCEEHGILKINIQDQFHNVEIIKASTSTNQNDDNKVFDYYAFSLYLGENSGFPVILASYHNEKEVEEILQILSTFKLID